MPLFLVIFFDGCLFWIRPIITKTERKNYIHFKVPVRTIILQLSRWSLYLKTNLTGEEECVDSTNMMGEIKFPGNGNLCSNPFKELASLFLGGLSAGYQIIHV